MASVGRRPARALSQRLRTEYAAFDYYQLIRALLRGAAEPGMGEEALDKAIRFRADLSSSFPGREVSGVDEKTPGRVTLTTPNYCVAGYLGPLPDAYTEWLQRRAAGGDRAMADFLDLFNHRANVLRYRIKARSRLSLRNEVPEQTPLAGYLAAVMGLGDDSLMARLPLPRRALLALAGMLADRRRSASVIRRVLSIYLGAPVEVLQLRGGWQAIMPPIRSHLGTANSRLGSEAVLGSRVWDQQARIELVIGPLGYARFCALLPGGAEHQRFVALLRYLTDRQVDCLVRLKLVPAQTPQPLLHGGAERGMRLGYSAWLADRDGAVNGNGEGRREALFLIAGMDDMGEGQ